MSPWQIEHELARLRKAREGRVETGTYAEIHPPTMPVPMPAPDADQDAPQRGVQTFDI
jgi:hypothetical protein